MRLDPLVAWEPVWVTSERRTPRTAEVRPSSVPAICRVVSMLTIRGPWPSSHETSLRLTYAWVTKGDNGTSLACVA